jgi:hypothetical protein
MPDFGISALTMVMHLKEHRTSFVLNFETEDGELFAMMLAMGFFERIPHGYRMALPVAVTATTVRAAVLKYAATQDDELMLHPEHLVSTVPAAEARARQHRLRAIEEFQYCGALGSA